MVTVLFTGTEGTAGMGMAYIIVLIGVFYFLLVRPQQKQRKTRATMMDSLTVGDEIFTAGGILGTITRIKDQTIWLRISEKCEIELLKSSIGGLKARDNDQ